MTSRAITLTVLLVAAGACAKKSQETTDAMAPLPRDTAQAAMRHADSTQMRTDSLHVQGDSLRILPDSMRKDSTGMSSNR